MPARLLVVIMLLMGVAALATGCGDSADTAAESTGASAGSVTATTVEEDQEHTDEATSPTEPVDVLFPPAKAPELGLRDHTGQRVSTEQFRGKAVFVTFVYASCPDICPVIVANMRRTLDRLGPRAKDVQMIAVSVDPEGDTPALITKYLQSQKMTGRMRWLVGSRNDLEQVWTRWGIATQIPRDNPDLVEHAAPIYGVNAEGVISTIYDHRFTSKELLRDIPELLGT